MILACANVKGGQGKSTWAANLAAHLKAPLLDLDPSQGDSHAWAEAARHPSRLVWPEEFWPVMEAAAQESTWSIADCPPLEGEATRGALGLARIALVPVTPSGSQDARAWGRMISLVEEVRQGPNPQLKVAVVLNALRPRTAWSDDFQALVREYHDPNKGQWFLGSVNQRVAVADAFAEGRMAFKGHGPEAQEFLDIFDKFDKIIKKSHQGVIHHGPPQPPPVRRQRRRPSSH